MNDNLLQRITHHPDICHGKPCIRGVWWESAKEWQELVADLIILPLELWWFGMWTFLGSNCSGYTECVSHEILQFTDEERLPKLNQLCQVGA